MIRYPNTLGCSLTLFSHVDADFFLSRIDTANLSSVRPRDFRPSLVRAEDNLCRVCIYEIHIKNSVVSRDGMRGGREKRGRRGLGGGGI